MSARNDERDLGVLQALADHGDVGAILRPVYIWIYGSRSDLLQVAARLGSGWVNTGPEEASDRWVIRAEREQPATEDAILAMVAEINEAMSGTQADFDGWETSVERSN